MAKRTTARRAPRTMSAKARKVRPLGIPAAVEDMAPVSLPASPEARQYRLHRSLFKDCTGETGAMLNIGSWLTEGHWMLRVAGLDPEDQRLVVSDAKFLGKFARVNVNRGEHRALPDFDYVLTSRSREGLIPYTVTPWTFRDPQLGKNGKEGVLLVAEDGSRAYLQRAYLDALAIEAGRVLYCESTTKRDQLGCTFYDNPEPGKCNLVVAGIAMKDSAHLYALKTFGKADPAPVVANPAPAPVQVVAQVIEPEPEPEPVPDFPPFEDGELPESLPEPIRFPVPTPPPAAPPAAGRVSQADIIGREVEEWARTADLGEREVTVSDRTGTVWIKFPQKPRYAIRQAVSERGFYWSGKRGAWYFRLPVAADLEEAV